jgi:hypothetical protein
MSDKIKPQKQLFSEQVGVKKKHRSGGWSFSCFAALLFEQDLL